MENLMRIAGEIKALPIEDKRRLAAVMAGAVSQHMDVTKIRDTHDLEIALIASMG